jgi:hypothetical protein
MDKSNQKMKYNKYNPLVLKKLKEKYGLSTMFINQSLRGERTSDTSTKICQDYKIIEKELNKTLNKL